MFDEISGILSTLFDIRNLRKDGYIMIDFNKKRIGALILEKIGTSSECYEAFDQKRAVLRFDKAAGSSSSDESDKIVIDRLEEERNYIVYAIVPDTDGTLLYLVVTDDMVKRVNINIEYGNDPFDSVLKKNEDGSAYMLSACADTPEAAIRIVDIAVDNGILYCL